jgi:hypothetical protein
LAWLARILHEGNEAQGKFGKQGGSIKIGSQIFPDFVQVQTVFFGIHDIHA